MATRDDLTYLLPEFDYVPVLVLKEHECINDTLTDLTTDDSLLELEYVSMISLSC